MIHSTSEHLDIYNFKNFSLETLVVKSTVLRGNPLKDSHVRRNPVLVPKINLEQEWPVVLVLAGFSGNGPKYFSPKSFEPNMPEVIDRCAGRGEAPQALYVFVDAVTFWGGSQFINSVGTGSYEDYIIKELVEAIKKRYPVSHSADQWCVTGGSSGGYGALHLASKFPRQFALAAAIAPDSFFEASLLPDVYSATPIIEKLGGVNAIKKLMQKNEFLDRRGAHSVLNAIGMAMCYSPNTRSKQGADLPVDSLTGELRPAVWRKWKKHDPIEFLKARTAKLAKLSAVMLDVGKHDQYHLHFGARQIKTILKRARVPLEYSEFEGNHFDIGSRRPHMWEWLCRQWS